MPRSSPAATTVDLDAARTLSPTDAGRILLPAYARALRRLPSGRQVFRGLPFDLGPAGAAARFVLVDRTIAIPLPHRPASHVVVAHLCDTWRDAAGRRPRGVPVGHVVPIGEPLARYSIATTDGARVTRLIRRRFEVNDGLLGWGSGAFGAFSHVDNAVVDWRGPHARQVPGRYAPAGQSGSLTIMPGTYGAAQVGMTDYVPSPTEDALLWLHAIAVDAGSTPTELVVEPVDGVRPGRLIVLAAVTLFDGRADPLSRSARFAVRIEPDGSAQSVSGAADGVEVDLGTVLRTTPPESVAAGGVIGWGSPRHSSRRRRRGGGGGPRIVELSIAPDAVVAIDGAAVRGQELLGGPRILRPGHGPRIRVLPPPTIPVAVDVVDAATNEPISARVRFVAADGRYLPPDGHRDEVNPGFFEDTGGDLILGGAAYAYVPSSFSIGLPAGPVDVEVVAGFARRPLVERYIVDGSTQRIRIPLQRAGELRPDGWMTADSHVHFLSPSTALLQADAEDLDLVNLLAAQWGDLFTSVADVPFGSMTAAGSRRQVVVGTENRQNLLGHLALLGARRPTTPLASGGPPEGRMAGALTVLLADWADRCRAAGGLVVAAHFPLPYAEIAADIIAGKIDAVEAQALSPTLDDPAIVEWYRFLNLGDRLPIVAGTDKMSAEVPVGAVRTFTHVGDGEPAFDRWADTVRRGRTFVSSGPFLRLSVDGCEPGDVIRLDSARRLAAEVRAEAAQAVITDLEVVVNGKVVAATSDPAGARVLSLETPIEVTAGCWIAARSRSRAVIESAFTTAMAAHTSPIYVEVAGRPIEPRASDASVVEQVILGARTWVADVAAVATPTERQRMLAFFDANLGRLRARLGGPPR